MPLDLTQIDNHLLDRVRLSIGAADDINDDYVPNNSQDDKIAAMSPKEFLDAYLAWEGIHGYTDNIWHCVEQCQYAETMTPTPPNQSLLDKLGITLEKAREGYYGGD